MLPEFGDIQRLRYIPGKGGTDIVSKETERARSE